VTATPAPGRQTEAVESDAPLLLVTGGPGTGKTRTALLAAKRVLEGSPPGAAARALFLTFSRAAVGETLERSPDLLTKSLAERLDVWTFHGFARLIIDSFGRYAGMGTEGVRISSEAEAKLQLAEPGSVTFDDLVPRAIEVLRRSSWALDRLRSRYAIVISDEYQDTGDDQDELLRLVSDGRRFMALADPAQMIYTFRPDVGVRRIEQLRGRGVVEIPLEPTSHRDPSGNALALATALSTGATGAPPVLAALADGRLHVVEADPEPWDEVLDEIGRVRALGAASVGVFVSQRRLVDEFAQHLAEARVTHEIAGVDDAAGEAEVAIATMAQYSAGMARWAEVQARIAVFLTAARRGRQPPDLAIRLTTGAALPAGVARSPERLRGELDELAGSPLGGVFEPAATAMAIFGWGDQLWRIGMQDLRGQALEVIRQPLDGRSAERLSRIAGDRRTDGAVSELGPRHAPVRLMTHHQAKGREMDAIVIVAHPVDYFGNPPDLAAWRRLMFVAISRSRKTVSIILGPDTHEFYGRFHQLASPAPTARRLA
jgi:DNA helicase-2/ATP-dependent DNA helicase PcrA